jgi:hypothetical protein
VLEKKSPGIYSYQIVDLQFLDAEAQASRQNRTEQAVTVARVERLRAFAEKVIGCRLCSNHCFVQMNRNFKVDCAVHSPHLPYTTKIIPSAHGVRTTARSNDFQLAKMSVGTGFKGPDQHCGQVFVIAYPPLPS